MIKRQYDRVVVELGSWFAEQLGCDPKDVRDIDLHFHMDEIATADVKLIVNDGSGVAEKLQHYQLVRRGEMTDGE